MKNDKKKSQPAETSGAEAELRRRAEERLNTLVSAAVRPRAENEMQRLLHELQVHQIELEAFNYTVTHDLRNPLTTIHGYCQVLQDLYGNRLDEQCKGYIREMYEGTLRMNRLIDTLLDFSRVTRVEMHRKSVDLSATADGSGPIVNRARERPSFSLFVEASLVFTRQATPRDSTLSYSSPMEIPSAFMPLEQNSLCNISGIRSADLHIQTSC
jgi:signal transduction histidine kinase